MSWLAIICLALEQHSFFIHIRAYTFFIWAPNKDFSRSVEESIAKHIPQKQHKAVKSVRSDCTPSLPLLPTVPLPVFGLSSISHDSFRSLLSNRRLKELRSSQQGVSRSLYSCHSKLPLEWGVPGICWQMSLALFRTALALSYLILGTQSKPCWKDFTKRKHISFDFIVF